jgi:hypothetical protein
MRQNSDKQQQQRPYSKVQTSFFSKNFFGFVQEKKNFLLENIFLKTTLVQNKTNFLGSETASENYEAMNMNVER